MNGRPSGARRRLVGVLAAAGLWPVMRAHAQLIDEFGSTTLKGAGSTFAHPLMSAWAREYRAARQGGLPARLSGGGLDDEIGGVALDYEAIGSQAGIQRAKARAVDFAVSEMPLGVKDQQRDGLLQVPLATGAVAVAINLGTATRELRLTAAMLADIFLGRIKTWLDPAIAQLNPGIVLPNAPIAVVHRADGSGTTFTFTQFLAAGSPAWKTHVGSDLLVKWPVGNAVKGNTGVARALERTANSIGYVNWVEVSGGRLTLASVQNAAGAFVAPSAASVRAAVAAARWDPESGFDTSVINIGGEDSYPIVAVIFALTSHRGSRRAMTRAFLEWTLADGRATAERLGYISLPPSVVQTVRTALR